MSSHGSPSKWTKAPSVSRNGAAPSAKSVSFIEARRGAKKPANSIPKKLDRRIRHTREALGGALIALMQEKPFDSITVQQVLERARVGHSTFYKHFRDKEDLFFSDVDEFFALMCTALDQHGDKSNRLLPAREFFAHVADVRPFIRALNDAQKFQDVMELGKGHFARSIEARLTAMPTTGSMNAVSRAARAHALSGAFISLLEWWLCHQKAATPEQMDVLFHQLAWSGLQPPLSRSSSAAKRR